MLTKYNRRTVSTSSGETVPHATVTFYWQFTGLPATVYADPDGNTPLGSSVQSDPEGRLGVFLHPGYYRIVVTLGGDILDELTYEPIISELATTVAKEFSVRLAEMDNPASDSYLRVASTGFSEWRTPAQVKTDLALDQVDNTADADKPISNDVATALNGKIDATQKGAANGIATLNASGQVPAIQLPSFVDDVLEVADYASLPDPGESGKIYITADNNKQYRWTGSAWAEMVASPGSTDAIAEGSTNLYFTEARVRSTPLTGYALGTNTTLASTDTILAALGKVQGQLNGKATSAQGAKADSALQPGANISVLTNDTGFLSQEASDNRYTRRSNNLSDLDSVSTARANLGLVKTTSATDTTAGRMLQVGDGGINAVAAGGTAPNVLTSRDLNTLVTAGLWYVTNPTNGPAANGYLIVQNSGDINYTAQIFIAVDNLTGGIWHRIRFNGTWTAWNQSWHSGNLVKTANSTDTTAGRMLQVGDGGINGNTTDIPLSPGLNGWTVSGLWRIRGDDPGRPAGTLSGYVIHNERATGSFASQLAVMDNETLWFRLRSSSGTWTAWNQSWHSGNLVKTTSSTDTTAGRMLQVGDFGIGIGDAFPNVDFNTLTTPGKYSAGSASSTNTPVSASAYLIDVTSGSVSGTNNRVVQLAYGVTGAALNRRFTRYFDGTLWSAWAEVWNSGNLTKTANSTDTTAGRMLQVGDFGLGNTSTAPIITDCNQPGLASGHYVTSAAANIPTGESNGTLVVYRSSSSGSGYGSQVYLGYVTGKMWFRELNNGVYGTWREIWHSGNLTKTANATDTTAGRMLQVGDFGLGIGPAFITADLDTVLIPGQYAILGSSANVPLASVSGILHVKGASSSGTNNRAIQEFTPHFGADAGRSFRRTYDGASWSAWREEWNSGNLTKTANSTDTTAGRMLQVGDGGVNCPSAPSPRNLLVGADCNGLKTSGLWHLSNPTNGPVGDGYLLVLNSGSASYTAQIFLPSINPNDGIYHRKLVNGTWGAWHQSWHSGNFDPAGYATTSQLNQRALNWLNQYTGNINRTLNTSSPGSHVYHSDSTSYTYTIPTHATVGLNVGVMVTFVNDGAANVTIAPATGVTLVMAGSGATGNRTLAQHGMCTILKVGTDRWFISGTGVS